MKLKVLSATLLSAISLSTLALAFTGEGYTITKETSYCSPGATCQTIHLDQKNVCTELYENGKLKVKKKLKDDKKNDFNETFFYVNASSDYWTIKHDQIVGTLHGGHRVKIYNDTDKPQHYFYEVVLGAINSVDTEYRNGFNIDIKPKGWFQDETSTILNFETDLKVSKWETYASTQIKGPKNTIRTGKGVLIRIN